FGHFDLARLPFWEHIFSELQLQGSSVAGSQKISLKLMILSPEILCPSFSRRDCIVFGPEKWLFPVKKPLLLTTRCAGTPRGQLCIAQPTIRAVTPFPR